MGVDFSSYGTPRADLGEALHEFVVGQDSFIATKLFPLTPVTKKAANYPVVTRKSLLARAETRRAARSGYNRTNFQTEDKNYNCEENGLEGQLDASERTLYKNDFDAEMETSKDILMKLLREQEIRVASAVMTETLFDDSTVFAHCNAAWATNTTDIIKDVAAAKLRGFNLTGMELNMLTISRTTLNSLMLNTKILDAIRYVQGAEWGQIKAALASILGVEQILVGGGVYDTKPEGATAFLGGAIWSNTYALLSITPATGSIIQPSLGRTFQWVDEAPENAVVESYDEPQTRSTVFRVRQFTDEAVIEKQFGQLIDVTATS